MSSEAEWKTRKARIDPRLVAAGWRRGRPAAGSWWTEEESTESGPADYVLWVDGRPLAVVEAKKVSVGPQEKIEQAERYSKGLPSSPFRFDEYRVPFLYATSGEVIWFRDARSPENLSRQVAGFHTPGALEELLGRGFDAAVAALEALPHDSPFLRPYQLEANQSVEHAIAAHHRRMLVAMATGTGKTFTLVNQIYRLMKSGLARRILFLVDRKALAAQAVRAFSTFEAEPATKFDKIYEVYSNRFHAEDLEDEKFDPKLLPQSYLTDPKPGLAFVYVATIQRMAINILGRNAIFGLGDEILDNELDKLDIPIHAFDVIIADECHRGYTSQEISVWRSTLDHFDAIKVGLTATPAAHTTGYFQPLAFRYDYKTAVREGYLVDYQVVNVKSDVRMNGVFLNVGENVEVIDPKTGMSHMDQLEDARAFESDDIEATITAPDSNRRILQELKTYAEEHEREHGRFPKTLIFAVNDLDHTSHADQLVALAREVFGRGADFVDKITGKADRPLQKIREFRNRPQPAIAVTVDLLSTGIDIPDLEFIVFLRPVKSRILFEQMMGRGTRIGEKLKGLKTHFTVFDCFDGTLLAYMAKATSITAEMPDKPTRTIAEVIDAIWQNRDRDYNVGCLVKRLHRIDKEMGADARTIFAAYIPDGDVARYARALRRMLEQDFVGTMRLLRDPVFQDVLVNYPRPSRVFLKANGVVDDVSSERVIRDGLGRQHRPEDYLEMFSRFVRNNPAQIDAIRILLERPREWSGQALSELREKLAASPEHFSEELLRKAHQLCYQRAMVDIVSMVKHAADERQQLLTAAERVDRAVARISAGRTYTPEQQAWLDRIREHLRENLSIDKEDFEDMPVFNRHGGWGVVRKVFGEQIDDLLQQLNEGIAA